MHLSGRFRALCVQLWGYRDTYTYTLLILITCFKFV